MRADEAEPKDRIRHPVTDQVVEIVRVRNMLSKTRVHFKAYGSHGSFDCPPHAELKEIP